GGGEGRVRRGAAAGSGALLPVAGSAHTPAPPPPQAPPSAPAPVPQAPAPSSPSQPPVAAQPAILALVPLPAIVEPGSGEPFSIVATTIVKVPADAAVQRTARQLIEWIRRGTGLTLTTGMPIEAAPASTIAFVLDPQAGTGPEGYDLVIASKTLTLTAASTAGLFYGSQTIRQLLPYWSEYEAILYQKPRPATLPLIHIRDTPRYEWRGAMLDVARHFFTVDEVKQFVDLL